MTQIIYPNGVIDYLTDSVTRGYVEQLVSGPINYMFDLNGIMFMMTNAESLLLGLDLNEIASEIATSTLGYDVYIAGPAVYMSDLINS